MVPDPELAADLAESDGHVSHAGEGILGGRAVAAAVAAAMTAADCDEALGAALHVIPADSWCGRNLREGIAIGRQSADVWQAIAPLHETLVLQFYHWPDLAPEAVGLAFGMLAAARGDFETAVLGSVNLGRDADTIAAIAGAIAGALHGCDRIPARWSARIAHARGGCIQTVKGMSVLQTAAELAGLAAGRRTR